MQAKKFILVMLVLLGAVTAKSQPKHVQGTIRVGSDPNTLEVYFLPDYNSAVPETILYFSLSIAVPTANATPGLTPTIVAAPDFSGTTFTQGTPFSYVAGSETIYSWIYGGAPTNPYSFVSGTEVKFATITMGWGGNGSSKVKLVDFTNDGGGANFNTFWLLYMNQDTQDRTNYSAMFYTTDGGTLNTYPSGDQYLLSSAAAILPANLTSFSGYKNGSKNTLQWTTVSESNSRGFDVQHSTDGVNYSSIGFVASLAIGGNSNSSLNYSFDDNSVAGAKNYYRLRQVDLDGRSKLSKVVVVSGDQVSSLAISGTFPNPAVSVVNVLVDAPSRDQITLQFNDLNGKLVKQHIAEVSVGSNTIPVDVSGFAKGNYIIKLTSKSGIKTAVSRFVKQ